MKKAILNYVIYDDYDINMLQLESGTLEYIDSYTSLYKNDVDFINNSPKKDMIYEFIRNNDNKRGEIIVTYFPTIYNKEKLSVMYKGNDKISIYKSENTITEIEKAKKLLFSSKNQMFSLLLISSKAFASTLEYELNISYSEYLLVKKYGLNPIFDDGNYYVNFMDLFNYRIDNKKLGVIRSIYERMLEFWQYNLESMYYEDIYYYSRELKFLICKYDKLKLKNNVINNLMVGKLDKKVKLNKVKKELLVYDLWVNKCK